MAFMNYKILKYDPSLAPYKADIALRMDNYTKKKAQLLQPGQTLADFASGYLYFGFHKTPDGWYYREWAPAADKLFLTGDFCSWNRYAYPMEKKENGVFELFLPGENALTQGSRVMTVVQSGGRELERIPLYAHRVEQDPDSYIWNAVIHNPLPFDWTDGKFKPKKKLFVYECHIGMAQEEGKVSSYREFTRNTLPRIKKLGYNAIQIMAIMEHPYYASFGYQVTNFFACSSRFGMPEDLKELVNTAHKMGIAVLLDVVHSHACKNTREGINEFDGTPYQFFHTGSRGEHSAWGTKCFDYGKNEVIHFLLSNLKYWLEEYHFDGFRFDGITSMLYLDHGLGTGFDHPSKYFSMNTDVDAITYLQLATEMIRQVKPHAILIAEDMSAMPGMCLPIKDGGIGFDYRLAMGEPDLWIRLLRDVPDENWDLNGIYYELTCRRPKEKVIGYCESHDQALVGDKTLMFRLCDKEMYWSMAKDRESLVIDRGIALHKLLRLLTMTLGGEGYLTFMGNEFGHPEWIDFPREGNGWSYHYCRRQWHLADDKLLRYHYLLDFEKSMVALVKKERVLYSQDLQLMLDNEKKTLVYQKGVLFAVNLHPTESYEDCVIPVPELGTYTVTLSTDDYCFGGQGRVWHQAYSAEMIAGRPALRLYLPSRTAVVLKHI
ncbi:MAG: alpha amylase C-terminal domain-containing protein [Oscillospiraceae bacterium]|nr:alpha amylase C-terminal domain-containing protein [Oscillospiraceae bacterium]